MLMRRWDCRKRREEERRKERHATKEKKKEKKRKTYPGVRVSTRHESKGDTIDTKVKYSIHCGFYCTERLHSAPNSSTLGHCY